MNDKELVEKILRNDKGAFGYFIKKYQQLIYLTSYRLLTNKSNAEDITQEVFLEVFRSLKHLRNTDDLQGWLFKITYNKSLSFLRKKNPAKASAKDADYSLHQNKQYIETETPESKFEREEARKIMFKAIDNLPENQKKVLLLHKFEGFSQKEICELTHLSQASVESLIYRAKLNLRKSLVYYFKNQIK
jgi:RNA polymerase sigma-70 factor (ECF subfamily)